MKWQDWVAWSVCAGALAVGLVIGTVLVRASGHEIAGDVSRVVDGDTFYVGSSKIRLCGIQAPDRGQESFYMAAGYMAVRVSGRPVRCLKVGSGTPCDGRSPKVSWGRTVAQCFIGARDIAAFLVEKGYAVDWPQFSGGHYARKGRR